MSKLPTELVLAVVREAAELFVIFDRDSILSLALTARFVNDLVKPILYRRIFVDQSNVEKLDQVFKSTDYGKFVLDICISAGQWRPDIDVISHFRHIRCLRGLGRPISHIIDGMSLAGHSSLFKIHLWKTAPIKSIPPSVTHLVLYFDSLPEPFEHSVRPCLDEVPSLKHLAIELVARQDSGTWHNHLDPEAFAKRLCVSLQAGGERLESLSVRLCGDLSDGLWNECLKKAQQTGRDESFKHLNINGRIRIWRDQRVLENPEADMAACKVDLYRGVDAWSEAQPLTELN